MSATLFENARFYSGLGEGDFYPYLLVENGRVKKLCATRPNAKEFRTAVDLQGRYAYPCLLDGHVHLLYTMVTQAMGFDICEIRDGRIVPDTLAGIEARLRAFSRQKGRGRLVVANNYILSGIRELRLPTRQELDEWCGGRPVILFTIDGHASAVSTDILCKLGFDPATHNGILTGEDNDRNMGKLTDLVAGAVTPAVLAQGVAKVENLCAEYGISHLGALEGNGDSEKDLTTRLLIFLARRMRVNVHLYLQYFDVARVERFRRILRNARIGGCGSWEMDGATGSHSAAHALPYKDTGERAPCYYTEAQVRAIVQEADAHGYQIAAHAIGECAIDRYVSALMDTRPGRLHRLEHGEFMGEDALKHYGSGKFAVMVQPGYSWIDKRFLHSYEQFLEPAVIGKLKLRSLFEAGAIVCGSSDAPVQSLNPFQQMQGMVEFYDPAESVSIYDAFRSYTVNAARALEADDAGRLTPGAAADFFTSDADLFALPADALPDFRAAQTFYGGRLCRKKRGTVAELLRLCLRPPHKI